MDYDILILGGGIIGCSVAYELSKYNFNIALIERDYDIADDISFVNTSIVYDGSETSDDVMAGLEYIGNSIMMDTCKKFKVPFRKIGALRVVNDENGVKKLQEMYDRAKKRGIDGVYLIDDKDVYDIEPNINPNIKKGLYSENIGIVAPYDLAIAYAEVASDNGVNFRLEEEVLNIQSLARGFKVTT
ncbi:FAD-dependent oxidoreductase, partial [Clostridium perfringens]